MMAIKQNKIAIEHIGLDVEFHHQNNTQLELSADVIQAYENDKEHAEIFIQSDTNLSYSSVEILKWFLMQTQTSITDHMPKNTSTSPTKPMFVTFPMRFRPGMFHMFTSNGKSDMSHLRLMCKLTFPTRTVDE